MAIATSHAVAAFPYGLGVFAYTQLDTYDLCLLSRLECNATIGKGLSQTMAASKSLYRKSWRNSYKSGAANMYQLGHMRPTRTAALPQSLSYCWNMGVGERYVYASERLACQSRAIAHMEYGLPDSSRGEGENREGGSTM